MKLTDDSSIWTQNWPWTPVPEDGEITYAPSVCNLCPGGCGISVRKIDGRPVKIEGMDEYPVNNGGACLHGIAGLQYLYDPARVKTPLKRNGDRFEKISWDDALELAAEKLSAIRGDEKPEGLACITGSDLGSVPALFKHFMAAFGSSNTYTMPSLESYLDLTAETIHGPGKTIGFDLENSDFVLSFGTGFIEGWGSPVACFKANATRKERHAKLYQVEPRLSNTAAAADKWIPAKPGTEADLALSMCAVILEQKLFDAEFVATFKGGFNKFHATIAKEYAPAKVAAVTGIAAGEIKKMAVAFAKAKAPVAIMGKGRGAGSQSLKELAAVHTLNCICGRINKKGGAFVMDKAEYLTLPEPVMDEVAQAGAGKDALAGSVNGLVDALNGGAKLDALMVYNANPCYSLNDPKRVKEAFKNVGFVVSLSSFMDETAMASDLVLPVSTFLERYEDVPSQAGLDKAVVGLAQPIVGLLDPDSGIESDLEPLFDTMAPGDILISLASSIEGVSDSFEWESYGEYLVAATGELWDSLSEEGYVVVSEDAPAELPEVNFSFLSANPETIKAQGDFNLTLIPIDNMRLAGTVPAASPFAIKTVSDRVISGKDVLVEVNPETAKGIADCGYAILTTAVGSARVRVNLNHGMMPGVIGMVRGLGHTFDNKYVADKGVNVNDLIGPVIESGSGLDAAFGIKAKLSKA
ncbi:MAG: molybdopterin-dependent oxidoreductase [Desulfobacterales bacterium]|nr:molybdopterin-dependent oxidoreductase [Desulfobacterales bacterium]